LIFERKSERDLIRGRGRDILTAVIAEFG
jgi:hypothetical protein